MHTSLIIIFFGRYAQESQAKKKRWLSVIDYYSELHDWFKCDLLDGYLLTILSDGFGSHIK